MRKNVFKIQKFAIFVAMMAVLACKKAGVGPVSSEEAKFEQFVQQAKQYAHIQWQPKQKGSAKIAITADPSNPNNPFDYVGALHNQGLDYFIQNYQNYPALIKIKNGKKEFSLHEMWKIVGDFGRDNNIQGLRQLTLNPHFRNAMNQEFANDFPSLRSSLSSLAYSYYERIIDGIYHPEQVYGTSTSATVCNDKIVCCKNCVAVVETDILNDVHLSAEEKVILLCGASVARYSYAYWTATWADKNDAWWSGFLNEIQQTNDTDNLFIYNDAGGAIFGAVWNVGYNLATGSDITASGVIGSALGGAIGASTGIAGKIGGWIKKLL